MVQNGLIHIYTCPTWSNLISTIDSQQYQAWHSDCDYMWISSQQLSFSYWPHAEAFGSWAASRHLLSSVFFGLRANIRPSLGDPVAQWTHFSSTRARNTAACFFTVAVHSVTKSRSCAVHLRHSFEQQIYSLCTSIFIVEPKMRWNAQLSTRGKTVNNKNWS